MRKEGQEDVLNKIFAVAEGETESAGIAQEGISEFVEEGKDFGLNLGSGR